MILLAGALIALGCGAFSLGVTFVAYIITMLSKQARGLFEPDEEPGEAD